MRVRVPLRVGQVGASVGPCREFNPRPPSRMSAWGLRKRLIKVDIENARARQSSSLRASPMPDIAGAPMSHAVRVGRAGAAWLLFPGAAYRCRACSSRVLRSQDQTGHVVPPEAAEGQAPLPSPWGAIDRPTHGRGPGQDRRSAAGALAAVPSEQERSKPERGHGVLTGRVSPLLSPQRENAAQWA